MSALIQDLRYGLRMLWKSPATTLVAVLTLGLGIGANTTIFSWVRALLIDPLPAVREMERLAVLSVSNADGSESSLSYPDFVDYRDRSEVLEGLAAYDLQAVNLGGGGKPERVWGMIVSGNYFEVMGVTPTLGRGFLPAEDREPGAHPVAVISHGLWQRRFGGDPSIVGREIPINNRAFTVVGIAPPDFHGSFPGLGLDVWVPLMMQTAVVPGTDRLPERGNHWLDASARLKRGVSRAKAEASMSAVAARVYQEQGGTAENSPRIRLLPVRDSGAGEFIGPLLAALLGVVAVVLLIACANIANLMLAKATVRGREAAVRLALGASRARLVRQFLTESILLGILGGMAGWLMAQWTSGVLAWVIPPTDFPVSLVIRLDGQVLLFTLVASILTGLIFGLAPALQASRTDPAPAMKGEGALSGKHRGRARLRGALVVAQVSLSLILLICGGLFLRSLERARTLNPGFDAKGVLLASMDLFPNGYDAERGQALYQRILERVASLPGVEQASLARKIPLSFQGTSSNSLVVEGYQPGKDETAWAFINMVGPAYFQTMRIPLLQGRDIESSDTGQQAPVAIVNEAFARRYWPGQEAVGRRIQYGETWVTVVAVARDGKYHKLDEPPSPYLFLPVLQFYRPDMTLHVRVQGDPLTFAAAVQHEILALDPDLPVFGMRTLEASLGAARMPQQLGGLLLGSFGLLALLLASVGLYGVMAFTVGQRVHEVGIRMALGAGPADIRRMIVRQGMLLAGLGVAIGWAGALGAGQLLSGFLFGVSAVDPLSFAAIPLLLAGVTLLACYLPARRASKVDPMVALRFE
jgi:predicted permease